MRKLVEVADQPLEWIQPSAFTMSYELRTRDDLVATLYFRSMFGTFATAQSGDGCWTFKRTGFWQTLVTIRGCDSDTEVGSFKRSVWSGGGGLVLPNGDQYPATTNVWQTKLEFQDDRGESLLAFKSRGLVHLGAAVEVHPRALQLPVAQWMILLGWYLVVMMHADSSGVAGAVAAGA